MILEIYNQYKNNIMSFIKENEFGLKLEQEYYAYV